MASLMNGLSAMGQGVANFAATAGLEQQKADLATQQLTLADQLATTRESAGRQEAGQIAATAQEKQNAFAAAQSTQAQTAAAANIATQEAGATGRTAMTTAAAADLAQKQQAFDLQKMQMAAQLPTPEERDVIMYTGGAKPGTPEFKQGVIDLALVKAGISPNLYGSTPTGANPASTPDAATPGAAATSTTTTASSAPGTPSAPSAGSTASASGSTPLPPIVAAAVGGDNPPAPPKPGAGLSYKPIEPGLDSGPPPGGYNESILQGKPAWLVAKVHAINEGREEPPSPRSLSDPKSPEFIANALLNQYNPNFDQTLYQARLKTRVDVANGPLGAGITAANTVLQHANEFAENATALNNGRIPIFNWVENKALDATGSPRPQVLQATVDALASEARKVYAAAGGGTQAELDAWQKNFPINGSPVQQQAAMTELVKLLHGRLNAVASQINGGMQTNLTADSLLNPAAKASYDKLVAGPVSDTAKIAPAPADVGARTVGQSYSLPNGKTGTWRGTGWEISP